MHSVLARIGGATREEYLAEAVALLRRGRHAAAAVQLAAALSFDPEAEDALALGERWLRDTPQPLRVLPAEGEVFFGLVALRALALARAGQLGRGVVLLLKVAAFRPSVPFLGWARAWAARDPLLKGAPRDDVLAVAAQLLAAIEEGDASPGTARTMGGAVVILDALDARSPSASTDAAVLASMFRRRMGARDEALAKLLASRGERDAPFESALAAALRDVGRFSEALAALQRAAALDPSSVAVSLDLAEALADEGRFEQAAQLAHDVAARCGAEVAARARSVALYADALAGGDEPARRRRAEDALASDGSALARALLSDLRLGCTELPPLHDRLAALIRSFRQRPPEGHGPVRVRVELDGPLPAAAPVAFQAVLAQWGRQGDLLSAGTRPGAAETERDEQLATLVAELVAAGVDVERWCREAPTVTRDALDALVHAPPAAWARGASDPVAAVYRAMVAALASSTAGPGDPLALVKESCTSRDTWLAASGLTALGGYARLHPEAVDLARAIFREAEASLAEDDARALPLFVAWSGLVGAPPGERARAHRLRRARERQIAVEGERRPPFDPS